MKFLATALVSLLIIVAVLIPGKDLPDVNIGGYDKLIHMAMFAAWAVAVRFDLRKRPPRNLTVFSLGLLFSLLTEVLQLLVEGRSFDLYDMAADALGLAVGILVAPPVVRFAGRLF